MTSTQGLLCGDEAHVVAQFDANMEMGRTILVELLENNDLLHSLTLILSRSPAGGLRVWIVQRIHKHLAHLLTGEA